MSVSNFKSYSDEEEITYHDENIVIICNSDATCFGSDPLKLIQEEKKRIDDCPTSVDATPEPNGLSIVRQANTDHRRQMELLVNSLWLIQYSCLLESDYSGTISNNANLVPDQGHVVIWVDCDGSREDVRSDLTGIIPQAYIQCSESDFRRQIWGYLSNTANPENGAEDLREWSQEVTNILNVIDPD